MKKRANEKRFSTTASSSVKTRTPAGKALSQSKTSRSVCLSLIGDEDTGNFESDDGYESPEDHDEDEKNDKMEREAAYKNISVYWQNRFVPETTLKRLPFFPTSRNRMQCSSDKIPLNWKDRIKGFIFFDNKFSHISNNKLRLQVDPNLEEYLTMKARDKTISYDTPKIELIFLKWLQDCHVNFDRDFRFEVRDRARELASCKYSYVTYVIARFVFVLLVTIHILRSCFLQIFVLLIYVYDLLVYIGSFIFIIFLRYFDYFKFHLYLLVYLTLISLNPL